MTPGWPGEGGVRGDEADNLDDPGDAVKVADDALDGGEGVDGADGGEPLGVLRGHGGLVGVPFGAGGNLARSFEFAVNKRQLARGVNVVAGDDGGNVGGHGGGDRREGQSQLGEALLDSGNWRCFRAGAGFCGGAHCYCFSLLR